MQVQIPTYNTEPYFKVRFLQKRADMNTYDWLE